MDIENLKKRLDILESEVVSLKKELLGLETTAKKESSPPKSKVLPKSSISEEARKPKDRTPELEWFIGGNLLGKAGLLAILLASIWFIKYAFDNRWVNESGRILIGLSIGFGVSFSGLSLAKRKFKILPESVLGTGFSVVYLSIFGAYYYYDLFALTETFVYLSFLSLLSSGLAYWIRREILYIFGLFGSLLSPILISQGENSYQFLFGYLLFLNVIFFLIGTRLPWRVSPFILLIANFFLYFVWSQENIEVSGFTIPFLFLVFTFLLFSYRDAILYPKLLQKFEDSGTLFSAADPILVPAFLTVNSVVFAIAGYRQVDEFYPNLTPHYFLFGSLALISFLSLFRKNSISFLFPKQEKMVIETLYVYLVLGFTFASLSDFSEGNWTTFSWIFLAGSASLLGVNFRKKYVVFFSVLLWFLALFRLYFFGESEFEDRLFLLNEYFALYVFATVLLLGSYYMREKEKASEWMRSFIYAGIFTLILGTLFEVRFTVRNEHYRNLGYSYVLAFYSFLFLFVGFRYSVKSLRITGTLITSILVAKLYLYDIWTMSLMVRIVAGFSLGVGLVLTSMFYQKFKDRIFISKNIIQLLLYSFAGFILLGGSENLSAEPINTKGYRYYKEIRIPESTEDVKSPEMQGRRYGRLELSEDIVRHSGTKDRRLVLDGKNIPFIVKTSEETASRAGETKTTLLFKKRNEKTQVYVLKLPAPPPKTKYTSILAEAVGEYEVIGAISLGKTPEEWDFESNFKIYNYSGNEDKNKSNEIKFESEEAVFVRIEANSDIDLRFPVAIYSPKSEQKEFQKIVDITELKSGFNSDTKSSLYYYSNPLSVPIHRIVLFFKEDRFNRGVTVYHKDSSKKFEFITFETLEKKKGSKNFSNIRFPYLASGEIKISIANGDDSPLTLEKMEVYILKEEIIFPLPDLETFGKDSTLRLYYGNSYAIEPEFDLQKIYSENDPAQTLLLDPEKENENFGYSISEPPVSTWILRIFFFSGLAVLSFLTYRVFRGYALEEKRSAE